VSHERSIGVSDPEFRIRSAIGGAIEVRSRRVRGAIDAQKCIGDAIEAAIEGFDQRSINHAR
jgi:hypothetical protein